MKTNSLTVLLLFLFVSTAFAQGQPVPQQKAGTAAAENDVEKMVDQWFIRLNALDDWFISMDGKEQPDAVVDRFVELYGPAALHQVSPSAEQVGPVVYSGHAGIRKWAMDFATSYVRLGYRVDFMTRGEKPSQLVYSIQPAWGGKAAAVEFSAVYTTRNERKRFLLPGSAFFIFDEAGKIQRVRLYLLQQELTEIQP